MDASRFDRIARALASCSSRRSALRAIVISPVLALTTARAEFAGSQPRTRRKKDTGAGNGRGDVCAGAWRGCAAARARKGANLSGCDFSGVDLSGRDLAGCNLSGASLRGANLRGASLKGGNLSDACFANALLHGASLRGSNLGQSDISGANLAGADLRGANVSSAQLASALLCNTRMPSGGVSDRDLGTNGACASCDKGCPASEACCDGGCVDLAVEIKHCFACGNRCPDAPPHATVRCGEVEVDGQLVGGCLYTCDDGWDDCDNAFENGCEVETRSDAANCGICGFACPAGTACRECHCVEPGTTDGGVCPAIRNAKLIRRP